MDIDWTKITDGFRGFEKLAVKFVQENEKRQKSRWKKRRIHETGIMMQF